MNIKRTKFLVLLVFALMIVVSVLISTRPTVISASTYDETADLYKAKCAMCHGANAAKLYNPETSDEEHVQVILKGKKGEKPPYMPAFEEKGITEEQAKALAAYMRSLRAPKAEVSEEALTAAAATYKAKCAMCHGPAAAKFYNPETSDEEHAEVILKGKKGEKPPYMPGFGEKGIAENEAKVLAIYMRKIREAAN